MKTPLSNCCKARIMLRTAYQTIYPSCIKCDKPCDYTPHQEGEEKHHFSCTSIDCPERTGGKCTFYQYPSNFKVKKCPKCGRTSDLVDMMNCPFCNNEEPTTKQGEDEFTQNTFRGATNLLYPPTTQSWEKAELAAFWEEIAAHLPKSLERSALGDEKISFAFKVAYPKMKSYIVATALKEQEERLVKALEAITFNGEDDTYLRGNRDGIKEAITLIKSTK